MSKPTKKPNTVAQLANAAHYAATSRSDESNRAIVSDCLASWSAFYARKANKSDLDNKIVMRLAALSQDMIEDSQSSKRIEYAALAARRHLIIATLRQADLDQGMTPKEIFGKVFGRLATVVSDVADTKLTGELPSTLSGGRQIIYPLYAFGNVGYASFTIMIVIKDGSPGQSHREMTKAEFFTMVSAYDEVGNMFKQTTDDKSVVSEKAVDASPIADNAVDAAYAVSVK